MGWSSPFVCSRFAAKPLFKPGGSLFERAVARFGIDVTRSLMIGDKQRDIDAAATVGVRGVLVPANQPLLPLLKTELAI